MDKTNGLFFELIRISLGKLDAFSSNPSPEDWKRLYALALKQTLIGFCFSGIERLLAEQRPPRELLMQWYGMTRQIEERNHVMDERTAETTRYFRSHGFKTAILKGQGIAQLYPMPGRRQSGDVDIWLYSTREMIYEFARTHDPEGRLHGVNYHHIHYELFEDTEVEVHIYPGYLHNPFANARLHKFFDAYPPRQEETPSASFNRIFILLHIYNHFIGHGVGLRQVMDYYYVLRNPDEDSISAAVEWLKKLGMMRFASATMWVLQEVFELEEEYLIVAPNEKEGRFLLEEICHTGNMGHYEQRHWGSLGTPFSRFLYNLRRDWHFMAHYPQEVCWQPLFSIWVNVRRFFWNKSWKTM